MRVQVVDKKPPFLPLRRIYGVDGQQIYGAAGSVCQAGVFCPCLGAVEFDITDPQGNPTQAHISKGTTTHLFCDAILDS